MSHEDRPHFRVNADRSAASRKVRYVETNRPQEDGCTLCQLDEENLPTLENPAAMSAPDDEADEAFAEARLIEAIENQIEADNPPAARAVMNKLTLVGHEREESLHLMALVLAHEIRAMLREDRPFDAEGYERLLRQLPELPED